MPPSTREKKAVIAKQKLINTVGKILKERGYAKLSINVVSEESGVDKPFIYRHFSDFDGLLKAYIEKQDYWLNRLSILNEEQIGDHKEFMKNLLFNHFEEIYRSEEFQQFMIWELSDKDGFMTHVAIEREILAEGLYEQAKDVFSKYRINTNMIYALFIAGVYYLVLHKDKSTFGTFDFTKGEDVDEFLKTLDWIIDVLFEKLESDNQLDQVVLRANKMGLSVGDIVKITGLSINRVNLLVHKINNTVCG